MSNETNTFYRLKYSLWLKPVEIERIAESIFGELALFEWTVDILMYLGGHSLQVATQRVETFLGNGLVRVLTVFMKDLVVMDGTEYEITPEKKEKIFNSLCAWLAVADELQHE